MSTAVAVRQARLEDLQGVMAFARSIAEAPDWSESIYSGYVSPEPGALCPKVLLVAESNAAFYGYAAVTVISDRAELESVAVAVSARRSGVGSALLAAVVTWALESGADSLELEVRAGNQRALAFYAARGLQSVGRRARYYKDPEDDAVLMRLDLNGK